ncbi:MAG: methyltransferase [Verrucomicrobiota bacterium]|nr:methyltransferase [Verrucomicrobiota bacterium]
MQQTPPTPQPIIDLANAFYGSSTLFAASDAGLFGELAKHPGATSDEVATALSIAPRASRLLLDACVALGLLTKDGLHYKNTPTTTLFLVPGSPADLSGAIRYNRDVYEAWGKLPAFLQSGTPVESPQVHLGDDANRTRTFVLSMHYRALGIGRSVIPLLDFNNTTKLLDCGGGPGTYAALCAKAQPALHCTVIDLPAVAAIADELIAQQGLSDRVKTLPGSYHDVEFPTGMDRVHFFGCLHQESPEAIQKLFAKAFAALRPGGKIVVMDLMTDSTHTAPAFSALFALNMALTTENGWVFSDLECRSWLESVGFTGFTVKPLPQPMPHWLAMATKPL